MQVYLPIIYIDIIVNTRYLSNYLVVFPVFPSSSEVFRNWNVDDINVFQIC